jgi:hypothetical protein
VSAPELLYCEQCGQERTGVVGEVDGHAAGEAGDAGGHRCVGNAEFEPPRYCGQCRRRMVVQVTPTGWSARCSQHGVVSSVDAGR